MKWEKEEIDFLHKNYKKYGVQFCSEKLKRTQFSIKTKCKLLGLRYDSAFFYKSDKFDKVVKESYNLSEICRKMKLQESYGNRQTIKK